MAISLQRRAANDYPSNFIGALLKEFKIDKDLIYLLVEPFLSGSRLVRTILVGVWSVLRHVLNSEILDISMRENSMFDPHHPIEVDRMWKMLEFLFSNFFEHILMTLNYPIDLLLAASPFLVQFFLRILLGANRIHRPRPNQLLAICLVMDLDFSNCPQNLTVCFAPAETQLST